jgi:hypothetical protein
VRLRKLISMREALESPAYFADLIGGPSWVAWRVLLIAIVGEALSDEERVVFKALTGRDSEPGEPVEEFWGVIAAEVAKRAPWPSWRLIWRPASTTGEA